MTFYIRDTREGIEVTGISVGGIQLTFDVGTKLTAYEIMRLSQVEGVYFNAREED